VSLLIPYAQYERTHDIPNPVWGAFTKSYTYTPATADKLNPILLKTRPDLVVLEAIHDYVQLSGAYPCAPYLTSYTTISDPILIGQARTCPVKRPVTDIVVTGVYVGIIGPDIGSPGAVVTYTVHYGDGSSWTSQEDLDANQYQQYYLSYVKLTCWGSIVITLLYTHGLPVSRVPSGAEYTVRTPGNISYHCKP
jgi:hypothetical protein